MTVEEFVAHRKRMEFTQSELAAQFGMSLRAIQDIENKRSELRFIHVLAMEMIMLKMASLFASANGLPSELVAVAADVASASERGE